MQDGNNKKKNMGSYTCKSYYPMFSTFQAPNIQWSERNNTIKHRGALQSPQKYIEIIKEKLLEIYYLRRRYILRNLCDKR